MTNLNTGIDNSTTQTEIISKSFMKYFSLAIHQKNISDLTKLCKISSNVTTFSSDINKFFNKAFKNNNIEIVKWFMTFEPSLNVKLDEQLLFSKLEKNNIEIIQLYVELEPSYNVTKLIEQSLHCGKIELADYLLLKNNSILEDNETMLNIFKFHCKKNNIQMIQYLIEKDKNLIKKNVIDIIESYKFEKYEKILIDLHKYYPDMFKDYFLEKDKKYKENQQENIELGYIEAISEPSEMSSNLFIDKCTDHRFQMAKLIYECYPDVIKYNWAIVYACETGDMEISKWLYEKRSDYPMLYWEYAFMWSCMYGKLDIIKWIYSIKPDININADCGDCDDGGFENANVNGFTMACTNGKLDVAKWLLEIDPIKTLSGIEEFKTFALVCKEKKYINDIVGNSYDPLPILKWLIEIKPDIDIHKENELAFCYACLYNIDIAKWLLEIKPDINISIDNDYIFTNTECINTSKWLLEIKPDINIEADNHAAFKIACKYNYQEKAEFLKSLNPKKYAFKLSKYGSIESWEIKINFIRKQTKDMKASDIQECPICMDKNSQVLSNCNHPYCIKCIKKICNAENKCPTCRTTITDLYPFNILKE